MSGRDANQLAADATEHIDNLSRIVGEHRVGPSGGTTGGWYAISSLKAALDELVALVGTLQQEDAAVREHLREFNHVEGEPTSEMAAVAESTFGFLRHRAEAAEAALATTRQALTEIVREYDSATNQRAQADATYQMQRIARRALADTGGDTA